MFSMWQCQMFHGEWIKDVSAGGSGQKNEGNLLLCYLSFLP